MHHFLFSHSRRVVINRDSLSVGSRSWPSSVFILILKNVSCVGGPSVLCMAIGTLRCRQTCRRRVRRCWGMQRGNNDKVIEIVLDIANTRLAKIPMKYLRHYIKDFRGRSKAE